jgi:hypothetical protein
LPEVRYKGQFSTLLNIFHELVAKRLLSVDPSLTVQYRAFKQDFMKNKGFLRQNS